MEDGVPGEYASRIRQKGNGSREYEKGTCCRKGGAHQSDRTADRGCKLAQKKTTTGLRTKEKKTLIDYGSQILSVKHQCELLDLPRSTAYYQSEATTEPDQEEIDIKNAIDRIHYDEPAYGCRRIKNELRKLGFTSIGKQRTRRNPTLWLGQLKRPYKPMAHRQSLIVIKAANLLQRITSPVLRAMIPSRSVWMVSVEPKIMLELNDFSEVINGKDSI
jgi:hypothetical protein